MQKALSDSDQPKLTITAQPTPFCRFLANAEQQPVERVQFVLKSDVAQLENFPATSRQSYVQVSLFTDDPTPRAHVHRMLFDHTVTKVARRRITTDCRLRLKVAIVQEADEIVRKTLLRTDCEPSEEERLKAARHYQNTVRIGAVCICEDPAVQSALVLSSAIRNCNDEEALSIEETSLDCGSRVGGDLIWFKCRKMDPSINLRLHYFEPETGWHTDQPLPDDGAQQAVLIKSTTPAYTCELAKQGKAVVNVALVDEATGACGQPLPFTYTLKNPEDVKLKDALNAFASTGEAECFVIACKELLKDSDEYGNSLLHKAVRSRQPFALRVFLKAVEQLPDGNCIINRQNVRQQTALHLAVRCDEVDSVHYLLTAGADRSLKDWNGCTVAHQLSDTFNEAIYKDVLFPPKGARAGKQPLDLSLTNNQGLAAIHLAIRRRKLALLESLIEAGADVSQPTVPDLATPLHLAVEVDDLDAVELLLKARAPLDAVSLRGATPMQLANELGLTDVAKRLLKAEEPTAEAYDARPHPNTYVLQHDEPTTSTTHPAHVEQETSPETAQHSDDFSKSVDYLTRLRLSRLLDGGSLWKRLASKLQCDHMVEYIEICHQQDQSSPTMLLLDQYEMIDGATFNQLVNALKQLGSAEIADLLTSSDCKA